MKAAVAMNPRYYVRRPKKVKPFPNAADKRNSLDKALDTILSLALCASVVTILLFVLALG